MGLGLQIRCYVNGQQQFIELYGNDRINLEVSFAEVQDITRKNSAYSQEFKVPGSKTNNLIFDYFYDINAVALDFNPKLKFEADILYNGFEIYNGYIRLNSVTINKLEKVYSVTFYTQVGDLASNIGDKALCDIDTSSLNVTIDYYDAGSKWLFGLDPSLQPYQVSDPNTTDPVRKGDVQFLPMYRGYDYTGNTTGTLADIDTSNTPFLSFSGVQGFFDNVYTPVQLNYLMPNVRIKKIYELICEQAGYTVESDFFETDYFKRYYLPLSFNSEQAYMAQAEEFVFEFINTGVTYLDTTTKYSVGPATTFPISMVKVEDVVISNLGYNPITPPFTNSEYLFSVPPTYPNYYEVEIHTRYTGVTGSGLFINLGQAYISRMLVNSPQPPEFVAYPLVDSVTFGAFDDGSTTIITMFGIMGNDFYYDVENYGVFWDTIDPLSECIVEFVRVKIYSNNVSLPQTIELDKEMSCERKQIEFIQDINRMFNLIVVEHPYKPNTLIVEPVINYIGRGEQLDWTDKVDYDSPQQLFPTTTLINGSIFASNTRDKDFINTEYTNRTNQTFGQQFIDLGVEYKNETINLTQKLGQNTDYYLNASGDTNIALSCFFITKENNVNGISNYEYRPFRSLPRVAFLGVPLPSGNTGNYYWSRIVTDLPYPSLSNWGLFGNGSIQNVNRLTTYPFAISGFSHYITYDVTNTFTPDELIYPQLESQYDRYYYDYIDDLTSEENKIYRCKMYLTPWEVAQLKFNETIFIKNAKFRLNKIANLNLLEPDTCDVELVKLTKDYTPTPVLCYDLVNCNDLCDVIHTNTDLQFPIFAFEGKYVTITNLSGTPINKRYKVIQSKCNPNNDYERVYLKPGRVDIPAPVGGGYNSVYYNYEIYDSCSGGQSTQTHTLPVYDSTLSSYVAETCYTFLVINTGVTTTTITYEDCYGNTSSASITAGNATTVCAYPGSIVGNNIRICYDSLTPCQLSITPTPTPSISNTPTPSVTPGLSPTQTGSPTPTPTLTPNCFKTWNITECAGGTCGFGICSCINMTSRTVYTNCSVTDLTNPFTDIFENSALTNPFTGDFRVGFDIYNSSGSGVTFVCNTGGPC